MPAIARIAGTEFLASVELLDLISLGQRWVEGAAQSQQLWLANLQRDLKLTADQLITAGPVPAFTDHVNRRTQNLAGLLARNVENNMDFLAGALRVHEGFLRALHSSQSDQRTSGIPEKTG